MHLNPNFFKPFRDRKSKVQKIEIWYAEIRSNYILLCCNCFCAIDIQVSNMKSVSLRLFFHFSLFLLHFDATGIRLFELCL